MIKYLGIAKGITIHPERNMKRSARFHGNPSNSSLKITIVNIIVSLDEQSGDHQSQQDSSCGDHENLYRMKRQSIKKLLRYISPDQSVGPNSAAKATPLTRLIIIWYRTALYNWSECFFSTSVLTKVSSMIMSQFYKQNLTNLASVIVEPCTLSDNRYCS